jgi:HPt (histidine-containing phosphotransfer) domain-containing protein
VLEASIAGDKQEVARAAHRLKGGAVSIGAVALATAAQQLESGVDEPGRLAESWQETATALRERIALHR